ncbi:hypothetical protein K2P97_07475 [bacterium]|nr:hypothetical protein [bacterium]
MKITDEFKKSYEACLKTYLPDSIIQNENFESSISESIQDLIELSTSEVCKARKKGLNLACDDKHLAERCLKLSDGTEFIAGARFKNLDTNFPFIAIQKSKAASADILDEIKTVVLEEFTEIKPKGFLFKDNPNLNLPLEKWSHTVFGEIQINDNLSAPSGLNFGMSRSLDWHSQYIKEYRERLNEKPELLGFVRIGVLSEFEEAAADSALLLITDESGFCGVVAGIKSPLYGLPSVYMIENYLSKRWIGKKVSPVAHTYFLKNVHPSCKHVWGTIYDKNLSSLNTALRVGRKIVETEYFYKFR